MELESAGEIVAGGLVATAVDRTIIEGPPLGGTCLNCGATLQGSFCSACGQSAHVHRSIAAFWHEFLHAFMHFDGKVWRTLPMLALRPGLLTRRYALGERAKFVSPMALFLFSVFLMFAVFGTFGGPVENNFSLGGDAANTASLDRGSASTDSASFNAAKPDGSSIKTGSPLLDSKLKHALENPSLLLYKMKSNSYKFSWLMIPLSLPFLWALFAWRRDVWLFDHLVFITYSICFMSLLLIFMTLAGKIGALKSLAESLIFILPPLHMFLQLKGAYELSKRAAFWRTIALLAAALIVMGLFAVAIVLIGLG